MARTVGQPVEGTSPVAVLADRGQGAEVWGCQEGEDGEQELLREGQQPPGPGLPVGVEAGGVPPAALRAGPVPAGGGAVREVCSNVDSVFWTLLALDQTFASCCLSFSPHTQLLLPSPAGCRVSPVAPPAPTPLLLAHPRQVQVPALDTRLAVAVLVPAAPPHTQAPHISAFSLTLGVLVLPPPDFCLARLAASN